MLERAAYKLYPIRTRVVNALTEEEEWITLAYVPQVSTEKGSAGMERSRLRRMAILQRVLYLAFRSTIRASHNGACISAGPRGQLLAFPRIILYLCDQPEERQVLCFKPGMCHRPCTMCEVAVSDLGVEAALRARRRCAVSVVERQLEAHGHLTQGREKRRRLKIEGEWSFNSQPPAVAAMAGLCTPPFLLCNIVAIDVLHVLDLGITRDLVKRLVQVLPSMCAGDHPVCGSFSATYAEAYRRLLDLGRRCKASRVKPGYFITEDETQATYTGREQRFGTWILPFLVAGLFGPGKSTKGTDSGVSQEDADDGGDAASRLINSLGNQNDSPNVAENGDGDSTSPASGKSSGATRKKHKFDNDAYRAAFSDTPLHAAVTAMFAEYALLVGRLTRRVGVAAGQPMTLSECASLAQQAQDFIFGYVNPILGHVKTTKIHRLLCHVLDSVRYHGKLMNANTSSKEMGHKDDKKHYARTNKRAGYTRQLVRHAHGTRKVLRRNAAARLEEDRAARVDGGYVADSEREVAPLRRARRAHLRIDRVGHLAATPGLSTLPAVLGIPASQRVAVPAHIFFRAQLPCG